MNQRKIIAPEASKKVASFKEEVQKSTDSHSHKKAILKAELRQKFVTLSDQIAESNIYIRNYKYKNADLLYPSWLDGDQRIVTKGYPYAKGGLLLVDEPTNEREMMKAYEKQKVLKKQGLRHIIIDLDHPDLNDCLEQLGEL